MSSTIIHAGGGFIYYVAFMSLFIMYDKALRKMECGMRIGVELTVCVAHALCLFVLSFVLIDYSDILMPLSVVSLVFPIFVIYKEKFEGKM